ESLKSLQTAFAADKAFGANPALGYRYQAAAFVIGMAATAADKLGLPDKAAFRQQALEWLQADLAAWREVVQVGGKNADQARQAMAQWPTNPALTSVRDVLDLATPPAQALSWQKLWSDVDALLAEAKKVLQGKK